MTTSNRSASVVPVSATDVFCEFKEHWSDSMRSFFIMMTALVTYAYAQVGDAVKLKNPIGWELHSGAVSTARFYKSNSLSNQKTIQSSPWQAIGPAPMQSGFYSYVSGRVSSLAVDPTDSTVVYCAAAGGGLWKTSDGGASWTPLTDDFPELSSGSVAIDPLHTNIVYYATGELNFNLDGYPGAGMYKSTDGGSSWTQMTIPAGGGLYYASKVEVAPSNDSIVYVAGYYDVYKSTNFGQSWTELHLTNGAVDDIVIDPADARKVYASYGDLFAGDSANYGIYKSTDGGSSWSRLSSGLPPSSQVSRISLAIARNNDQVLYAAINGNKPGSTTTDTNRVYKSTNGGASWSLLSSVTATSDFGGGQGWYNNVISVDPTNSNIVYLGGIDFWKSTNGGSSWTNLTDAYGSYTGANIHPDQHAISFSGGSGSFFYIGNDGGIWKTSDGGSTFTNCNTNLQTIQYYAIDADQNNSPITVGGTQDNGTEEDSLPSLVWSEINGGDGGYVLIDPKNSNNIFAEYVFGALVKSTDGGSTFNSITSGINESGYWTTPYVMDPNNDAHLFTGTSKIYKTTNGGSHWSSVGGILVSASTLITTMSISPANDSIIYAGLSGYRGASGTAYLFVSTNGGSSWTNVTSKLPTSCDFCRVTADPTHSGSAYLAVLSGSAHVLKTTDRGQTWTAISSTLTGFDDVPTKIICVDSLTGYIYGGTYSGVYLSTDDGTSWSKFTSGLPDAVVDDIAIQYSSHNLRVGTHGRGTWQLALSDVSLPAQLLNYTGKTAGNGIALSWTTASEQNNSGFVIMRKSRTDLSYVTIANYLTDQSLRGEGTSPSGRSYEFTDDNVLPGNYYDYQITEVGGGGLTRTYGPIEVFTTPAPKDFVLHQNYPNPFNPSTDISYEVPHGSRVSLTLYNTLGEKIADLVNTYQSAGRYDVQFNGGNLASGIYFCRIVAGGYARTIKLVLLK